MAKYVVCPECEGEGYLGSLGAFTPSELSEWYDDPDDYRANVEASMEQCPFCKAQRVVTEERASEWDDYREYQAERAAEARYFGGY
jgi:hypothetical protein